MAKVESKEEKRTRQSLYYRGEFNGCHYIKVDNDVFVDLSSGKAYAHHQINGGTQALFEGSQVTITV